MIAEDCEDRYRDQCDKLRAAVKRLEEAEARSEKAMELLAIARVKKELESQVSILERYTKSKQTITTEATK